MEQFKWNLDRDYISLSTDGQLVFTKEGKIYHKDTTKAKIRKSISWEEVECVVIEKPTSSKNGILKIFIKEKAKIKYNFEYETAYIYASINKKTYHNICLLYKILKENDIEAKTNVAKYFNTTILSKTEKKEKVFQEKKKQQCDKIGYYIERDNAPYLSSGARKFWIPLTKYVVICLLSILSFLFLSQYTHITKWVIVGLWGVMTIVGIWVSLYCVAWVDGEWQYTRIFNKLYVKKEWLNNKTFEQGEKFKNKIIKSVKKSIRKNNFWGIIIFDIITLVIGIGLYFSAKTFAWGIPMRQAMLFELYSVIGQNLIYIIYVVLYWAHINAGELNTNTIIEEQFREYYWRRCPDCGGIMAHTVLSIQRENEIVSGRESITYTRSNQHLGTYTVGGQRIGIYGDKKITTTSEAKWRYNYIGKVIGVCHNCGKTENKEGQIKDIDHICPNGSIVKYIDEEEEKKKKEIMETNKKRKYI